MIRRNHFAHSMALVPLIAALTACENKPQAAPAVTQSATAAPASAAPAASTAAPEVSAPPAETAPPESIAAQHILIAYRGAKSAPKDVKRSKADAKKLAEEIVAKARGGANFGDLVQQYSEDPGSKERQGSLGKFKRDAMVKPFSDAAFALKVGEVSDAVESPFGFHVIKRNQ